MAGGGWVIKRLITSTVPMHGVVRLCISFHVSSIALDIIIVPASLILSSLFAAHFARLVAG